MASVLTNLEAKGLIRREPSPVHAKVQIASPTDEGQAALDRAYQEVIILERSLTAAFTPAERASLGELLERTTAVLVEQTPGTHTRRTGPGTAGDRDPTADPVMPSDRSPAELSPAERCSTGRRRTARQGDA
ncbi:hypothetical protein GCM10010430_51880 [Kitasatospora cystarginea]|uniref:HTH marR-type domain-containing protein n=1 Tax=Kitasatospora cystarginea TaxID=58350 RepID=A0ABN3EKA8_9ACTN